jgi:GWxTD domain-containing protein
MGRIARVSRRLALFLLFALPAVLPAATLPELFRKAKDEVKLGSYDSALKTLEELEAGANQPGFEKDKAALAPVLAFYKGVCHAALGKTDEARAEFTTYLATSPNASMDPAMYPKKVVATFEETRKASAPAKADGGAGGGGGTLGITTAYQGFPYQRSASPPEGEDWADGPAHLLLTAAEADEYRHLADAVARSEFITKFWKARDPKPETPENEFRDEFEKRAAFADQYFGQGERRGSLTDRGMVFILLGPPARSSQKPLQTGDDTADPAALPDGREHGPGERHRDHHELAVGELEGDLAVLPEGSQGPALRVRRRPVHHETRIRRERTAERPGVPRRPRARQGRRPEIVR